MKESKRKLKKTKAIEVRGNEIIFNLASDQGNADWLRTNRLLKDGKVEEAKALFDKPTYEEE